MHSGVISAFQPKIELKFRGKGIVMSHQCVLISLSVDISQSQDHPLSSATF